VLPNGLTFNRFSGGDQPVCRLRILFCGGQAETGNKLISKVMLSALAEGTHTIPTETFADLLDYNGVRIGSDSHSHYSSLTIAMLNHRAASVTPLIASMLAEPLFPQERIYTMLRNHKGKITVKIGALAASAASIVAMAGDETLISPTGMLMVHDPACLTSGNKADIEKAIELLEEVKESIINAYEQKTHLSRAKIAKMMSDETWLNAKKALQLGFVDGILFAKKEPETDEPEEDESDQNAEEDTPDEYEKNSDKPQKNQESMLYSPATTTASLMQKISILAPSGVPINQLEKRLSLLKH